MEMHYYICIIHKGDFYDLDYIHPFKTENKLKSPEKVCKNKDFCGIAMPSEKNKILEFNQHMKSDKMPYIIYADMEFLIKRQMDVQTIQKTLQQKKFVSMFFVGIQCRHNNVGNWLHRKQTHFKSREKLYEKALWNFKKNAKNIIDFEKKKMLLLIKEELNSDQDAKVCNICEKIISKKLFKSINYWKVGDHCHSAGRYRGAAHSICNLNFNVVSGSNYDYHFIIKELANMFEGKFECIGENIEKYKTFFVLIKKEVTNTDKDRNESIVTISYKIKIIDSARFIAIAVLNLVDNLR